MALTASESESRPATPAPAGGPGPARGHWQAGRPGPGRLAGAGHGYRAAQVTAPAADRATSRHSESRPGALASLSGSEPSSDSDTRAGCGGAQAVTVPVTCDSRCPRHGHESPAARSRVPRRRVQWTQAACRRPGAAACQCHCHVEQQPGPEPPADSVTSLRARSEGPLACHTPSHWHGRRSGWLTGAAAGTGTEAAAAAAAAEPR
jgi:hypothetical protein